jgi:hypothetical protein
VKGKSLAECNPGKVAVNIGVLEKPNTQFTLEFHNRYTERRLVDLIRFCKGHLATFELALMIAKIHHIGNID